MRAAAQQFRRRTGSTVRVSIPPPPYGPHPYQTWPPYGRRQPSVNGLAIAALVVGILCFVPAIGLILGLLALRQIKRKGERGKGMAIAGSVLSSVGIVLWALFFTTGGATAFWDGFKEAARDNSTLFTVEKGECFDTTTGSLEGLAYDVDEVPCKGRHDGEVFAVVEVPDGTFPGDDTLTDLADDKCYALESDYVMDAWALPEHVDVYYLTPTRQSWRLGDREITCIFGNTDAKGSLTGSLRTDETTLDPHQLAYLQTVTALDEVLEQEPAEYPDEDLPANTGWAQDMEGALVEQAAALREHTWPTDTKQQMEALATQLEASAEDFGKAADATDPDVFFEHYESGYDFVDGSATMDAREALGLSTTPPAYDYDDGDEGEGGGLNVGLNL
jgi:hypothetical protein